MFKNLNKSTIFKGLNENEIRELLNQTNWGLIILKKI